MGKRTVTTSSQLALGIASLVVLIACTQDPARPDGDDSGAAGSQTDASVDGLDGPGFDVGSAGSGSGGSAGAGSVGGSAGVGYDGGAAGAGYDGGAAGAGSDGGSTGAGGLGGGGGSTLDTCKADSWPDYQCGECMEARCSAECEAFYLSPLSVDYQDCYSQCDTSACRSCCAEQSPGAVALLMDWLETCYYANCFGACQADSWSSICDSGLTTGKAKCDACLGDACCQEFKDCLHDAECEDCLTSGTSDVCGGDLVFGELQACMSGCYMSCGGENCGVTVPIHGACCNACLQTHCCDRTVACYADQGCIDMLQCVADCDPGDTACRETCHDLAPDSAELLDDLLGCMDQSCATDCDLE